MASLRGTLILPVLKKNKNLHALIQSYQQHQKCQLLKILIPTRYDYEMQKVDKL